jgi:cystathionine beta-lyase
MKYNFDTTVERIETSCVKYDLRETIFGKSDVIPMWVADMDFETPDFIREAVIERALHPIYGYTFRDSSYYNHIVNWLDNNHQWKIEKESVVFCPGVVPALNFAVLAFTKPKDKIIVQPPVYFPFFGAVKSHDRELVYNQLLKTDNGYIIDYELLNEQAKDAVMLILCNPHNPVGRAWKIDELEKIAEICLKNNVMVLSDEIHADLVLPGFKHEVFANISPEVASITITTHAPSKTFNLAGLATSSVIITNPDLRKIFKDYVENLHIGMGNIFGMVASNAAYEKGNEWRLQLVDYINDNVDYVDRFITEQLPLVRVFRPEATYMVWLDFSKYGLSDADLKKRMIFEAGLGLNAGTDFGPGGEGCLRMNVACQRKTLEIAMHQFREVFSNNPNVSSL